MTAADTASVLRSQSHPLDHFISPRHRPLEQAFAAPHILPILALLLEFSELDAAGMAQAWARIIAAVRANVNIWPARGRRHNWIKPVRNGRRMGGEVSAYLLKFYDVWDHGSFELEKAARQRHETAPPGICLSRVTNERDNPRPFGNLFHRFRDGVTDNAVHVDRLEPERQLAAFNPVTQPGRSPRTA
jgi:hypothetical protein